MVICPFCKKENPDGQLFCLECGYVLDIATEEPETSEDVSESEDSSYEEFVPVGETASEDDSAAVAAVEPPVPDEVPPVIVTPLEKTVDSGTIPVAIAPVTEEINVEPFTPPIPAPVESVQEIETTAQVETALPIMPDPVRLVDETPADNPVPVTISTVSKNPVPAKVMAPIQPDDSTLKKKFPFLPLPAIIGIASGLVVLIVVIIIIATAPARRYRKAIKAMENGDYNLAATEFEAVGNFKDAQERAAEAVARNHYEEGKKAFESGDYDLAKTEFAAAGDYLDAADMAKQSEYGVHYAQGMSFAGIGDYINAVEEFKLSGDFKDSAEQAKKCYYQLAEAAAALDSMDEAANYYNLAGNYQDASRKASEIYYKCAEKELAMGNTANAAKYFSLAGVYEDADQRAKEMFYKLGLEAYNKKDYDAAADYFKQARDYSDAATRANESYLATATIYLNKKDYDKAGRYLGLAGDYKAAQSLMIKTMQALVKAQDYDNARKLASNYSGSDAATWNNYIDGMIAFRSQDYLKAASLFKQAGDFLNSKEAYLNCNYNQGILYLKQGYFSEARASFVECGSYKFAKDLINVCDAEEEYSNDRISAASQLYSKVSKKADIKAYGFDVQGRKTFIANRLVLEKAKGNYNVKSNTISVKHVESDGYTDEKKSNYILDGQYLTFGFELNSKNTFDITITVYYARYRNYSYYNYEVSAEIVPVTIKRTNLTKMPSSLKIDDYTKLKFEKGVFTLVYAKNEKSGTAINQFRSTVNYKKVS